MKLRKMSAVVLVLVMCLALAACSSNSASAPGTSAPAAASSGAAASGDAAGSGDVAASGEVIEISFAHDKATTHPVHLRYEEWAADLAEATDGRVKITFYPAQSLLTLGESYEGIRTGVADISVIVPSITPGVFPMLELFDLPVHYSNCEVLSRVFYESLQQYDLDELSEVKVLNVYCMGPGGFISGKQIENLDDLKGKQIRAVGLSGNCVEALGASPVSVSMPETYEALYRGVCDGVLCGLGAMTTWNLIEAAQNVTITPFLSSSSFLVSMNKNKWNSLPDDIKEAFETVSAKYQDVYVQGEESEALQSIDIFAEQGLAVNSIDEAAEAEWMALMQPVIEKAIQDREQYGPAQEFYDNMCALAAKYNPEYTSYMDYYTKTFG